MNIASNKTVLIVNDSLDQREMMQFIFEQAGCRALIASSGREAFQTAQNTRLDLVISDVMMPDGDGIELCQWIRADARLRSLPILLVSGLRKDAVHAVEGLEAGADDYVELPVDPLQLIARAERLIERKRMEDMLRESENYFRSLIENISDIITILSADGTILYESPSVKQILGFQPSELIGKNIFDFVHADDLEKVVSYFKIDAECFEKTMRIEYRFRHKTDSWRILESIGKFIEDPSRGTVIIVTSRDVTERKRTEQVLRESEENFRSLILATTQFVWVLKENGDGDVAQWWADFTGQTLEEIHAFGWFDAVHQEDRETVSRIWQTAIAEKTLFDASYRVRAKTGEYHHFAVRGVPVFNADGSFRQWIGTINDITELKQAEAALLRSEEQLRQSQKLESVGRLAGGIAHDFNNMLTAINGYSELTLRRLEENSPLRRNVEEIRKAGERSAQLTHQLLAFSRKQVLLSDILDPNEIITDSTKPLERLIGEDVRLKINLNATGHIKGDAGQLREVVTNLSMNARDAMPQGGVLTIETANVYLDEEFAASHFPTKPGSYIKLSIADNGAGMDEETQKTIFEPFYTTKETGKGTGLGLAMVYGIVKQSGGFIWVDSEIGAGSTFSIYLPCIDAEIKVREAEKEVEKPLKAADSILVVDDEDLVRAMTRLSLEECGYQVLEASSGAAALAICRQKNCRIDLVITDVMMPEMNGRELVEKLSDLYPQIRVLFTSGYAKNSDDLLGGIEFNNFIQKPFTFDTLARKVEETLAGKN